MGSNGKQGPGIFVRSERGVQLRDEKVKRLLHRLRTACPWLEVSDVPIARRFCELEVIVSLLYARIHQQGVFNADGEVRGLVDVHRRMTQTQSLLATQLGMTPQSRIAMQANSRNLDVDIEAALGRMEKVKAVSTDPDDQNT
jgi:hypothetical protein